jgi:hypothetical protein
MIGSQTNSKYYGTVDTLSSNYSSDYVSDDNIDPFDDYDSDFWDDDELYDEDSYSTDEQYESEFVDNFDDIISDRIDKFYGLDKDAEELEEGFIYPEIISLEKIKNLISSNSTLLCYCHKELDLYKYELAEFEPCKSYAIEDTTDVEIRDYRRVNFSKIFDSISTMADKMKQSIENPDSAQPTSEGNALLLETYLSRYFEKLDVSNIYPDMDDSSWGLLSEPKIVEQTQAIDFQNFIVGGDVEKSTVEGESDVDIPSRIQSGSLVVHKDWYLRAPIKSFKALDFKIDEGEISIDKAELEEYSDRYQLSIQSLFPIQMASNNPKADKILFGPKERKSVSIGDNEEIEIHSGFGYKLPIENSGVSTYDLKGIPDYLLGSASLFDRNFVNFLEEYRWQSDLSNLVQSGLMPNKKHSFSLDQRINILFTKQQKEMMGFFKELNKTSDNMLNMRVEEFIKSLNLLTRVTIVDQDESNLT